MILKNDGEFLFKIYNKSARFLVGGEKDDPLKKWHPYAISFCASSNSWLKRVQ